MSARGRGHVGRGVQDLPDDCLVIVFSHLHSKADRDAASLACRRWRALEALSRRSLCIHVCGQGSSWSRRILHTLHIFPHLSSITIYGMDIAHGNPGPLISAASQDKLLTRLRTLTLHSFHSDNLLACLAQGCPLLSHLHLHATDAARSTALTDKGIEMVLTRCPDMQVIKITRWHCIEGWGFRHGKGLKELNIMSGGTLTEAALAEGLRGLTSLEILNLPFFSLTDAALAEGLQGPTALKILNLPFFNQLGKLTFVGECCVHVEELCLDDSSSLDNSSVVAIAQGCRNLRVLSVKHCNNVSLHAWQTLATTAIKLQQLDVEHCERFCQNSLLAVQDGCPALRSLKVSGYHYLSHSAIEHFRVHRRRVKIFIKRVM